MFFNDVYCVSFDRHDVTVLMMSYCLQLSYLKQLVHLDIAENRFVSIPICALRMSSMQLLDLSNNSLTDLPQDMDR